MSERLGAPITTPKAGRGAAFGDIDNDGDVDVVVNNVNDVPDVFRLDRRTPAHWVSVALVGTTSNRNAIGARLRLTAGGRAQVEQVRGGGSYYAQNDFRLHFGLGASATIERVDVRWPNGREEAWTNLGVDRLITFTEGTGTPTTGTRAP